MNWRVIVFRYIRHFCSIRRPLDPFCPISQNLLRFCPIIYKKLPRFTPTPSTIYKKSFRFAPKFYLCYTKSKYLTPHTTPTLLLFLALNLKIIHQILPQIFICAILNPNITNPTINHQPTLLPLPSRQIFICAILNPNITNHPTPTTLSLSLSSSTHYPFPFAKNFFAVYYIQKMKENKNQPNSTQSIYQYSRRCCRCLKLRVT